MDALRDRAARVVRWIRTRDLALVAVVLTIVGLGWIFAAIADEVLDLDAQGFDESVLLAMREPHDRGDGLGPHWVEEMFRDLTALGSPTLIIMMTLTVIGYLLLAGRPRAALVVLIAAVGGWLLSDGLKEAFARERPTIVPHLMQARSESFPSGHSMLAAIMYPTLGAMVARMAERRRLKLYLMSFALVVALLVGWSRVYLGVHYPTDVLGGWAAGLAWALVCGLVARYLQHEGKVERTKADVEEDRIADAAG